jgi:hypothetical protein
MMETMRGLKALGRRYTELSPYKKLFPTILDSALAELSNAKASQVAKNGVRIWGGE